MNHSQPEVTNFPEIQSYRNTEKDDLQLQISWGRGGKDQFEKGEMRN